MELVMPCTHLACTHNTHTYTQYLTFIDDRPASSRVTPTAKSFSALPSSGWADHAQLKAHPLPAKDESTHLPTQRNGWMSHMYMPCYVHGKVKHNPEWLKSGQVWISKQLLVWLIVCSLFWLYIQLWLVGKIFGGRALGPFPQISTKEEWTQLVGEEGLRFNLSLLHSYTTRHWVCLCAHLYSGII